MFKPTFIRTALAGALALAAATYAKDAAKETKKAEASPAASAYADIQNTFGFVPQFFKDFPPVIVPGLWEEMKTLEINPKTALSGKTKNLIDLAVAAQIPCQYCIYAGTELSKLEGATQAEIGEAVAVAANTRHWSTFINGIQTDEAAYRAELAQAIAYIKKAMAGGVPAPQPIDVVDGASALRDITQTFGSVPDFMKRFPDEARAGAWKAFKALQLDPNPAVSPKDKDLISLAVSSQIPCKFCIFADTEFAKLDGASEQEITEAIAVGAMTREFSTLLNGMQVDMPRYRADLNKFIKMAMAQAKAEAKASKTAGR